MKVRGVRGAITVEENTAAAVKDATRELLSRMMELNDIAVEDICFILFSATADIDAAYPASAAREMGLDMVPLLDVGQMAVQNGLRMCIRILMVFNTEKDHRDIKHVYLRGARVLRPDLIYSVAIDGPAGAGKSTVARIIADKLNLTYVDTGAMYRAITLKALEKGASRTAEIINIAEESSIEIKKGRIYLDGRDVTEEIRKPSVDQKVSKVACIPQVRQRLVKLQRKMAENYGVVMDGRDIGTTVLPDAKYKFYLTADIKVRAKRRYDEMLKKGIKTDLKKVEEELAERDRQDRERECSPLTVAEDAVIIDTTDKTPEEVVEEILSHIKRREKNVL
ncbi:(d)CMP kinase [Thermosediminibacter litoriperuensis]|uniref:Cytidylate kinase n=1 Tax=Thermosediminibacter litoriperuensis TaxID=291989 RepID=A0A5S5AZF6_9FIRM|nr:(d)CMP kinase [Thermosediminibacter litoriperuensis]TYP59869.1 cytidylate kinase [Thermosediminibacter litoriperuensis]